jgi:hypothetical protein
MNPDIVCPRPKAVNPPRLPLLPRPLRCRGWRLEVRPHHEDDSSHDERPQQHRAEVKFCPLPSLLSSVHLNETSGATASALLKIELADHGTLG